MSNQKIISSQPTHSLAVAAAAAVQLRQCQVVNQCSPYSTGYQLSAIHSSYPSWTSGSLEQNQGTTCINQSLG